MIYLRWSRLAPKKTISWLRCRTVELDASPWRLSIQKSMPPRRERAIFSLNRAPYSSQLEIHRISMVTSSTLSRELTCRVIGTASADTTSSTCFTTLLRRDGRALFSPLSHPRRPWETKIWSSCRKGASTWNDSCANCLASTSLSTHRSSRFSLVHRD